VSKPAISIITPARNAAETIRETIISVQKQTFENWELIVINDGSTDKTHTIVEEFRHSDTRIRLIVGKGEGVSIARNLGLDNARGDFITFLDADDIYMPDNLEQSHRTLQENPDYMWVSCGYKYVDSQLNDLELYRKIPSKRSFRYAHTVPTTICALMIRTHILNNNRFDSRFAHGEDWLFIARLLRQGYDLHGTDHIGFAYRIHHDSAVISKYYHHSYQLLDILDIIYDYDSDCPNPLPKYRSGLKSPPKPFVIQKRLFGVLLWMLFSGEVEKATKVIDDLLFYDKSFRRIYPYDLYNTISFLTARYYQCNREEWQQRLSQHAPMILDIAINSQLNEKLPYLYSFLKQIVDGDSTLTTLKTKYRIMSFIRRIIYKARFEIETRLLMM